MSHAKVSRLGLSCLLATAACSPSAAVLTLSIAPDPVPVYVFAPGHGYRSLAATWTLAVAETEGVDAVIQSVETLAIDTRSGSAVGEAYVNSHMPHRLAAHGKVDLDMGWGIEIQPRCFASPCPPPANPVPGPLVFVTMVQILDGKGHQQRLRVEAREAPGRPL